MWYTRSIYSIYFNSSTPSPCSTPLVSLIVWSLEFTKLVALPDNLNLKLRLNHGKFKQFTVWQQDQKDLCQNHVSGSVNYRSKWACDTIIILRHACLWQYLSPYVQNVNPVKKSKTWAKLRMTFHVATFTFSKNANSFCNFQLNWFKSVSVIMWQMPEQILKSSHVISRFVALP